MEFFTSDTHFGHKNIVKGCSTWVDKSGCRDFASIEEHDRTIIDNINRVVQPNDVLYHLGDFAFGEKYKFSQYRHDINCKNIILVFGNHDYYLRRQRNWTNFFIHAHELTTLETKPRITMCHYPLQVWEDNHRGTIMLHGHCHQNLNHDNDGKILDVGVEGHDYTPWSLDEIMDYMKNKDIVSKDHH